MLSMVRFLLSGDIINFVEDIKNICPMLKEVSIGYSTRECNGEIGRVVKTAHNYRL